MAPQMRRCKECGKLFLPKGREQYCSDTHYRPCPICGTPVEVTYLSDPPKKCPACRYRKMKPLPKELASKSKSLFNIIPEDNSPNGAAQLKAEMEFSTQESDGVVEGDWMDSVDLTTSPTTIEPAAFCEAMSGTVMIYVGKQFKNCFQRGHKYVLKVERNDYVYNVSSAEDVSAGESCDLLMPIASQISFHQHFAKIRKHSAGKGHTY